MAMLESPALWRQKSTSNKWQQDPGSLPSAEKETRPDSREDLLFDTPSDLVCPITHELFKDPVINACGQVYEREAILRCLEERPVDPITRTRLESTTLTPVYIVRSRAIEYREKTGRACVEKACSSDCKEPVKYVRRAVELCTDGDVSCQGLSQDCKDYVQSHPSNAYDTLVLQVFARGLFEAGYRDRAAAVYYSLLQGGVDKTQQAELLRLCLACWTAGNADAEPDANTLQKLAQFVENQATFSWGQIIDIVQEAGLGRSFTVKLCEQLLFRSLKFDQEGGDVGREWNKQKQILVKYVEVFHGGISARQVATEEQVAELMRWRNVQEGKGGAQEGQQTQSSEEPQEGRRKFPFQRPRWMGKRALAGVVTVATLVNGSGLVFQAAKLVPVFLLMLPEK